MGVANDFWISIHAPVKGATRLSPGTGDGQCDFNPRTREGCDLDAGRLVPFYIDISIHAPVKGAT